MTDDIRRRQLLLVTRWLCYVLLLALCYLLQTNQTLFDLGGLRPLWLPALAVALAAFEDAFPSALFAMFAGLLWDFSSNRLAGFFGALLLICCFVCSCVIQLVLRRTVFNVAALCLAVLFLSTGLDFLLTYVLYGLPQRGTYYVGTLIPTMVYTVVAGAALYPLCRLISRIGRTPD